MARRHHAARAAANAVDQETTAAVAGDTTHPHHALAPIGDDQPENNHAVTHIDDELKQQERDEQASTSDQQPESLDAQIRGLFFPAMVTFSLDPLLGAVDTGMALC